MTQVLLALHFLVALSLVFVILLQRSDGGALGIGGGASGGGMFTARGQTNLLTKATAGLAVAFFVLSIVLAILSGAGDSLRPGGIDLEQNVPAFPGADINQFPIPAFPSLQ